MYNAMSNARERSGIDPFDGQCCENILQGACMIFASGTDASCVVVTSSDRKLRLCTDAFGLPMALALKFSGVNVKDRKLEGRRPGIQDKNAGTSCVVARLLHLV